MVECLRIGIIDIFYDNRILMDIFITYIKSKYTYK